MQNQWVITQEMVDWVRSLVGVELRPKSVYFNTEATRDTIRHFVDGIADFNPLWRDEEHARMTRYGRLVAPPSFLYSVYLPGGGMPNMGNWLPPGNGMDGGNDWEWYLPILESDSFTYAEKILGVVEKQTRSWGRTYRIDSEVTYWNQRSQVVAKSRGWVFRLDPVTETQQGKRRPVYQYTPDQLSQIVQAYHRERPRGAVPRYWEDVQVGEELPPVVRGPLHTQDLIAWIIGAGSSSLRAHGIAYPMKRPDFRRALGRPIEYQASPSDAADTSGGEGDDYRPALQHLDASTAPERGVGAAFDFGPQRMTWLIMLLTHWQGDDGFLKRLYVELRDVNQTGDTTWLKGRVARKEVRNREHLVEIECWGENQLGAITMPGRATVVLPSRSA